MENKKSVQSDQQKQVEKKKKPEKKFHGILIPQLKEIGTVFRRLKKLRKEYKKGETPSKNNMRDTRKFKAIYDTLAQNSQPAVVALPKAEIKKDVGTTPAPTKVEQPVPSKSETKQEQAPAPVVLTKEQTSVQAPKQQKEDKAKQTTKKDQPAKTEANPPKKGDQKASK